MQWPLRVQAIVQTLGDLLPELLQGTDDQRRDLNRMMAEQCGFELGPNWGTKRADHTRPMSKDVICTHEPFVGWDVQVVDADGVRAIAQMPESLDLSGQVFVPVDPINHLSVPTPADPPLPPEPAITEGLRVILKQLLELDSVIRLQANALLAGQRDITEALRRVEVELTLCRTSLSVLHEKRHPDLSGRVFVWPVTLKEKES